jgi:hypothetical protein
MNFTETALQLATAGASFNDIRSKIQEQGGNETQSLEALENVLTYYKTLADFNPDVEIGRAYSRLNLIFLNGLKVQDFKTAISAQKELNKLLGLYGSKIKATEPEQIYDIAELLKEPDEK